MKDTLYHAIRDGIWSVFLWLFFVEKWSLIKRFYCICCMHGYDFGFRVEAQNELMHQNCCFTKCFLKNDAIKLQSIIIYICVTLDFRVESRRVSANLEGSDITITVTHPWWGWCELKEQDKWKCAKHEWPESGQPHPVTDAADASCAD